MVLVLFTGCDSQHDPPALRGNPSDCRAFGTAIRAHASSLEPVEGDFGAIELTLAELRATYAPDRIQGALDSGWAAQAEAKQEQKKTREDQELTYTVASQAADRALDAGCNVCPAWDVAEVAKKLQQETRRAVSEQVAREFRGSSQAERAIEVMRRFGDSRRTYTDRYEEAVRDAAETCEISSGDAILRPKSG